MLFATVPGCFLGSKEQLPSLYDMLVSRYAKHALFQSPKKATVIGSITQECQRFKERKKAKCIFKKKENLVESHYIIFYNKVKLSDILGDSSGPLYDIIFCFMLFSPASFVHISYSTLF